MGSGFSRRRSSKSSLAKRGTHSNSSFKRKSNGTILDEAVGKLTSTESNGNYLTSATDDGVYDLSGKEVHRSKSIQLPLADKRVNVADSRRLLSDSKANVLSGFATIDSAPNLTELAEYEFLFENAVFEGGGVKGIAYIGALKVSKACAV